jgi:hypothetical protein
VGNLEIASDATEQTLDMLRGRGVIAEHQSEGHTSTKFHKRGGLFSGVLSLSRGSLLCGCGASVLQGGLGGEMLASDICLFSLSLFLWILPTDSISFLVYLQVWSS